MSKIKLFTVYKSDGTKQLLYGSTIESALDNVGWNLDYVAENVKDYREGYDDSLKFVNGNWYPKNMPKVTIKVTRESHHLN